MRDLLRPLLLVVLALMVPVLPFLSFGPWLESRVEAWLDPPPAPALVALATVGLLSSDILLPVPSSVVSTVAGSQLGVVGATLASWLGMTAGRGDRLCAGSLVRTARGRTVQSRLTTWTAWIRCPGTGDRGFW